MSEQFGWLVDFAIIIVLMILVPVFYISGMQDDNISTYVIHKVDLFGDQVCKNGYISTEMYESLINDLAATNLLYDIEIVHSHDTYYPTSDQSVQMETITSYTDEIKGQLYANPYQSLTNYDNGDYVYGTDGILYKYVGASTLYPYDPSLVSDFDSITGASSSYPYWEKIGTATPGKYTMQTGDQFSITVSNRSDTTTQKIATVLGLGNSGNIHAYGGGMIDDENY